MERAFKGIWIPKEIWLSENLTLQEKVFLVEIDSLDNDEGCFASNSYFAKFFGISTGRVSQVINSLKSKGYLIIDYETKDKQIIKRVISIRRPPYPVGIKETKQGIKEIKEGIKYSKEGYLENAKDNKLNNNKLNNNIYIAQIVNYLNDVSNSNYRSSSKKTQSLIKARLNEGFKVEDFKKVIDNKCKEWKGTEFEKYLRPETLFGTKFESYLNQKIIKPKNNEKVTLQADLEYEEYSEEEIIRMMTED